MTEQTNANDSWDRVNLGGERLRKFFLTHLDRIYAAKLHVIRWLPVIAGQSRFLALREAINDTVANVEKQIARMQLIYTIMDAEVLQGSINGVSGLIQDAFEAIEAQDGEPVLQDMSIIFYLQNIESVEMSSFQILQMAAVQLGNPHISNLLNENYKEAKADRTLLLLISSKYLVS